VLAGIFDRTGIFRSFISGDTFLALAAVISFPARPSRGRSTHESISVRREIEVWWLQLVGGIIQRALASGRPGYYGAAQSLVRLGWPLSP